MISGLSYIESVKTEQPTHTRKAAEMNRQTVTHRGVFHLVIYPTGGAAILFGGEPDATTWSMLEYHADVALARERFDWLTAPTVTA